MWVRRKKRESDWVSGGRGKGVGVLGEHLDGWWVGFTTSIASWPQNMKWWSGLFVTPGQHNMQSSEHSSYLNGEQGQRAVYRKCENQDRRPSSSSGWGLRLGWWWYGETGCWRCMECRLFSGNVGGGECGEDKRLKTVDYWSAEVRGMIPLSFISFTLPPHHHACAIPHVGTSSWPFPVITFSLTSHKSTSKQSF